MFNKVLSCICVVHVWGVMGFYNSRYSRYINYMRKARASAGHAKLGHPILHPKIEERSN